MESNLEDTKFDIDYWIDKCKYILIEILAELVDLKDLKCAALEVYEYFNKPSFEDFGDILLNGKQWNIVDKLHTYYKQGDDKFEYLKHFDLSISVKILKSFKEYYKENPNLERPKIFWRNSKNMERIWEIVDKISYVRNRYSHIGPRKYNKQTVRVLYTILDENVFIKELGRIFPHTSISKYVEEFEFKKPVIAQPEQENTRGKVETSSSYRLMNVCPSNEKEDSVHKLVPSSSSLSKENFKSKSTTEPQLLEMVDDIDMKTGSSEKENLIGQDKYTMEVTKPRAAISLNSDFKTEEHNTNEENAVDVVQEIIKACTVPEGDEATSLELLRSVNDGKINEVLGQILMEVINENCDTILHLILYDSTKANLITFKNAFQVLIEVLEKIENKIINIRTKIANIVALCLRDNLCSFEDFMAAFDVKLCHPLFLLCLSAFEKELGKEKLKKLVEGKINWRKMLPPCLTQTKKMILETLETRNLKYLYED